MNPDILFFFRDHPGALPLYEAFERAVQEQAGPACVKISATQISFANRYQFAFVSFLPLGRAKDRPKDFITVSFGLPDQAVSPRILASSQPYPRRWTHHVLIRSAEDIDGELMDWIRQAAAFSAPKSRKKAD